MARALKVKAQSDRGSIGGVETNTQAIGIGRQGAAPIRG